MLNYRIKNFAILITPLLLVFGAIYLIKDWNQGELSIKDISNVKIKIDGEPYVAGSDSFEISLWPDKYDIELEKEGYQKIVKNVEVIRHKKVTITPEFIFIPKISLLDPTEKITIPDEYKLHINNEIYFFNNESEIKNLPKKTLSNLPNDILYSLYSPNGHDSIIITSSTDLKESYFYYYNIDSEEIGVVHPDQSLSGPTWKSDSSGFAFILPREDKSHVMFYDISTGKETILTTLYNLENAKQRFAINNNHLLILPTLTDKDIIDLDLQSNRKEKITNDGDIIDMKVSSDTNGLFYLKEKTGTIMYLDMIKRKLFELPSYIKDIKSVGKYNDNKLVFLMKGTIDDENYNLYFYDLQTFEKTYIPLEGNINIDGSEIVRMEPVDNTITVKSEESLFKIKLDE